VIKLHLRHAAGVDLDFNPLYLKLLLFMIDIKLSLLSLISSKSYRQKSRLSYLISVEISLQSFGTDIRHT